jgi:hypothetical protein
MVFYHHMIYSPQTDNQVRHCSQLQLLSLQQVDIYNDTYSVHNEVFFFSLIFLLSLNKCTVLHRPLLARVCGGTGEYRKTIAPPPPWLGAIISALECQI